MSNTLTPTVHLSKGCFYRDAKGEKIGPVYRHSGNTWYAHGSSGVWSGDGKLTGMYGGFDLVADWCDTMPPTPAGDMGAKLTFAEAIDIVCGSSWRHIGDDAYSQGLDAGARQQVEASVTALESAARTPAGDMAGEDDAKTWVIIRDPGCTPQQKGPFPKTMIASFLREAFAARPSSYVEVVRLSGSEIDVQDGPECLQMLDGRSMSIGRAHIARLKAARDVARREPVAGDGWRPIETAPKDGTKVLLYVVHAPDDYAAAVGEPEGWKHIDIGCFAGIGWEKLYSGDPTHWRPLPAAPGTHATTPATTPATSSEEGLCRALSSAASPDGAGSGSEPVAWREGDVCLAPVQIEYIDRINGRGVSVKLPKEPMTVDDLRPLYAAPPASVDAVAVVTEQEAIESEARRYAEMYSQNSDGRNTFIMLADWIRRRSAALRARQQATEARS